MSTFGGVIRQIVDQESKAQTQVVDGVVQVLNSNGEHLVLVGSDLVAAHSTTDENVRVGDIVTILQTGQDTLILGGKK